MPNAFKTCFLIRPAPGEGFKQDEKLPLTFPLHPPVITTAKKATLQENTCSTPKE